MARDERTLTLTRVYGGGYQPKREEENDGIDAGASWSGRRVRHSVVGRWIVLVALANHVGKIMPVSESHAGATLLAQTIMRDKHPLLSGRYAAQPPDRPIITPAPSPPSRWRAFPGSARPMRS